MADTFRSVLICENSDGDRSALASLIRREIGCVVFEAREAEHACAFLEQENIGVLIFNFAGTRLCKELMRRFQKIDSQVVLVAAVPDEQREVGAEALSMGAFSYLTTPYNYNEAVIVTARALYFYDLLVFQQKRGPKIRKSDGFFGIIGKSASMQTLFEMIRRVADDYDSTVLIQGESGTGKELVAQAIHGSSVRKTKNFVPLNCAAIPDELLESELFGYKRGAFSGASQTKMGRIQYADGGTLFLDEIGDMKPSLQAKLLRVLQEKRFTPLGSNESIQVDVRVVSATHRDLEQMVSEGLFREDLYFRLSVIPLKIPPLRERKEDIPLLLDKFVQIFNRNKRARVEGFSSEVVSLLMDYEWPGNVRELENLVQRLVILNREGEISMAVLPQKYQRHRQDWGGGGGEEAWPWPQLDWEGAGVDLNGLVENFERKLIETALGMARGNKARAAELLKLNRTTLVKKIQKWEQEKTGL